MAAMAGVYTVTEINTYIKNMFTRDYALSNICIKGEVSNLKYHSSGHIYFTLKDAGAAINAIMFASRREGLTFIMKEGQSVEARGQIAVYEKAGTYQLYAREIRLSGRGELYERYEKLKRELYEMGMFDEGYKKPIPRYAKRIGIVTSATGAAIRDIMNISHRRNPYVKLFLYPATVQGESAKYSIVKGIEKLDSMGLDLIIVGRGGGSIEDLWSFNEELVARAVFNARTPIISAVGHEVDTTITDYVADLRAPTPSAAAELAVFDYEAFCEELSSLETELKRRLGEKLEKKKAVLREKKLRLSLKSPERILKEKKDRLSKIEEELRDIVEDRIKRAADRLSEAKLRMHTHAERAAERSRNRLRLAADRLELLSPLKRLGGGYGYVENRDKKAVLSVEELSPGDRIKTYFKDGTVLSLVERTEKM